MVGQVDNRNRCGVTYLFEGHEDLLSLTEVSEQQVKRSRHEGWVVMHCQMQKDP